MKKTLSKKNKIILITVLTLFVIAVTLLWTWFAYIYVNKHNSANYAGGSQGTRVIAHRGHSEAYYDNTEQAFASAAQKGFFSGLETDIWATKDGVFVCSHDVNPFVDKSVKITEKTYDEIKDLPLDVTNGQPNIDKTIDYRICTYEKYLEIVKSSKKIALIEIKGKNVGTENLRPAIKLALDTLGRNSVFFGSFDLKNVQSVHEIAPSAKTLLFTSSSFLAYTYDKMGYNVGANKKIVTEKIVKRAHDNGHLFFSYTVNSAKDYEKLLGTKLDFIISNVCID